MKRTESIIEALNQDVKNHVEYSETHQDAGDGYSFLFREGVWAFNNNDQKLVEFIELNDINMKGLEIDDIAELCLDNFKMISKHMFIMTKDNVFNLGSFPVGEVETQTDISTLKDATGLNVTAGKLKAITTSSDLESHTGSIDNLAVWSYTPSDIRWHGEIAANDLQDLIEGAL